MKIMETLKGITMKLPANWATTFTAIGTALMAALSFLASISYDQGPISVIIPIEYKPTVTLVAGSAALVLWVINGIMQKSKNVTGGSVMQDLNGKVVPEHKATLVQTTKNSTPIQ